MAENLSYPTRTCQVCVVGCQYYQKAQEVLSYSLSELIEGFSVEELDDPEYPDAIGVFYKGDRIGSISTDYIETCQDFIWEAHSDGKNLKLSYIAAHKLLPDGKLRWFIAILTY